MWNCCVSPGCMTRNTLSPAPSGVSDGETWSPCVWRFVVVHACGRVMSSAPRSSPSVISWASSGGRLFLICTAIVSRLELPGRRGDGAVVRVGAHHPPDAEIDVADSCDHLAADLPPGRRAQWRVRELAARQ